MSDNSSTDDPFAIGKEGLDAEAESFESDSTDQSTETEQNDEPAPTAAPSSTSQPAGKDTAEPTQTPASSDDDGGTASAMDNSPATAHQGADNQDDASEPQSSSHPLGDIASPDELKRTSLPPKLYRDSPKDNRKQIAIDLTPEEIERINELHTVAKDSFDEKIFKSDVKKAAFRSDMSNSGFLTEMRQIGYGYVRDMPPE